MIWARRRVANPVKYRQQLPFTYGSRSADLGTTEAQQHGRQREHVVLQAQHVIRRGPKHERFDEAPPPVGVLQSKVPAVRLPNAAVGRRVEESDAQLDHQVGHEEVVEHIHCLPAEKRGLALPWRSTGHILHLKVPSDAPQVYQQNKGPLELLEAESRISGRFLVRSVGAPEAALPLAGAGQQHLFQGGEVVCPADGEGLRRGDVGREVRIELGSDDEGEDGAAED